MMGRETEWRHEIRALDDRGQLCEKCDHHFDVKKMPTNPPRQISFVSRLSMGDLS